MVHGTRHLTLMVSLTFALFGIDSMSRNGNSNTTTLRLRVPIYYKNDRSELLPDTDNRLIGISDGVIID